MPRRKLQIQIVGYFYYYFGLRTAYIVASAYYNDRMEIDEKFNRRWSDLAFPEPRTVESRRFSRTHGEHGRYEDQQFHRDFGWMRENDYNVVVAAEKEDEMEEGKESEDEESNE